MEKECCIFFRAMEPGDEYLLYQAENHQEVFISGSNPIPYSLFYLKKFIDISLSENFHSSGQLRLIACLDSTEEVIPQPVGIVDFFNYEALHQRAELGILVLEAFRHRGIGKKMVEAACQYARNQLNLHQLYLEISSDNQPSLDLFRSCGFVSCGTKKDWLRKGQHWFDVELFQKVFEP